MVCNSGGLVTADCGGLVTVEGLEQWRACNCGGLVTLDCGGFVTVEVL